MVIVHSRDQHKSEVVSFLQKNFSSPNWEIALPPNGTGNETYFVRSSGQAYFIKLGAHIERYQVMSTLGVSPQVIAIGHLEDGTSILVQKHINGRKPFRKDFHLHLDKFSQIIRKTHQSVSLKQVLPKRSSNLYKDVGLETLAQIKQRWKKFKSQVPSSAEFVDEKIAYLTHQMNQFLGSSLVASHNDICNANWLVSYDEKIYLIDYESMSQDDPALDIGAILWWYYPPKLREEFLEIVGYRNDEHFRNRMRIRMALHCLNIILPREKSFDQFECDSFEKSLEDFRAVINGRENPQGYYD